jgi:hypothetical protein
MPLAANGVSDQICGMMQELEPFQFEDLLCGRPPPRPGISALLQQHKREQPPVSRKLL